MFFYNLATSSFTQGTSTQDAVVGIGLVFQSNPALSADGSVVAFQSSANLAGNNSDGNAEIYVANFSGSSISNIRQVTRTIQTTQNVNVLSPGRRLSRDGVYITFESLANDPKANTNSNSFFLGTFVYTVAADTFVLIGQRPTSFTDISHFPTFTDYQPGTLSPGSVVFASALNFRPDGTFPATAQASEGLNPHRTAQIFLTSLPASLRHKLLVRMTNTPTVTLSAGTRPLTSDSRTLNGFCFE